MARQVARAQQLPSPPVEGSLTRMVGLALEASGCQAAVGDVCDLLNGDGSRVEAEVVGFAGDKLFLMPTGEVHGLAPAARVVPRQRAGSVQRRARACSAASSTATARRSTGSVPSRPTNASSCWARPSIRWRAIPSTRRWMWACARSMRC